VIRRFPPLVTLIALLALFALGSSGCMTMIAPPRQAVFIQTDPPGATVRVGGQTMVSPARVLLDTREDWIIEASAPGYLSQTALVDSHYSAGKVAGSILLNFAAWGWWTLGIGGIVGIAVDIGSGSLEELGPSHVYLYLQAVPGGPRDYSRPLPVAAAGDALAMPLPPTATAAPQAAAKPPVAAAGAQGGPAYDPWKQPAPAAQVFCTNCGRKLAPEDIYCPGCGKKQR
jgi:hypothetical protein